MSYERTVTFGSVFEETPEGLWLADRIRRTEGERRAQLSPLERALEDMINETVDRVVLGLDPSWTPGGPQDDQNGTDLVLGIDRTSQDNS